MPYPPYRNKIVRTLRLPSPAERLDLLRLAGYNVAHLPSEAVYLDLLTDSGQAAMSDRQWAAMLRGDEAYAGSRSFQALERSVMECFGMPFVIPAHQGRGAENLLAHHLLDPSRVVLCNALSTTTRRLIAHAGATLCEVGHPDAWIFKTPSPFKGNLDLNRLDEALMQEDTLRPAVVWLSATSEPIGGQPISLSNLREVSEWAREREIPVVLDASRLHEDAYFVRMYDPGCAGNDVRAIAREMASWADYLYLSGKKLGLANIGGLIATHDHQAFERLRNWCVIFEGMPFYGGMAGRDMEALSVGLHEAFSEPALAARGAHLLRLANRLREAGVPLVEPVGGHAVYLDLERFPDLGPFRGGTLTSALYALSGVRAAVMRLEDKAGRARELVRLAWPARAFEARQIDWAAEAVSELWRQKASLRPLERAGTASLPPESPVFSVEWPTLEPLEGRTTLGVVPYRAKVVEEDPVATREQRQAALAAAGYNMYLIAADAIAIDLFTDSGTNAMSDAAWAELWRADEAYRGSEAYDRFRDAIEAVYGFPHVLPAHQGRGAEALLSEALVTPESPVVIGNQSFITTLGHIQRCGGTFVDVTVEEAYRLDDPAPFKGDVDLARLEAAIDEHGAGRIAYLNLAVTVNSSGGQPVRLSNLRAVRDIARRHGIPVYLDATRAVENAWFIRQHEPGFEGLSLAELLAEQCACADGVTVSGKKDLLANIGGFFATRSADVFARAWAVSERIEGFPLSGGLAHRDLLAMAEGAREMLDEPYVAHRLQQVQALGERLIRAGIPVIRPIGGHGVFVDAEAFLPHVGRDGHPGHALAAALYVEAGVRGMMVRSPFLRDGRRRGVELLRLTLPRRVYGAEHLDVVARALIALHRQAQNIPGLEVAHEPVAMRATLSRYREAPL